MTTATDAGAIVTLGSDLYDSILGEGGVIAKVEESSYFVNGHMADMPACGHAVTQWTVPPHPE